MTVPYKLQRKKNPQKPDEPGEWHATPKTGKPLKEKVMTRMATEDTTIADFELLGSAKVIARFLYNQTILGNRVRIPGLGTFRVSFGSEGVADITVVEPTSRTSGESMMISSMAPGETSTTNRSGIPKVAP